MATCRIEADSDQERSKEEVPEATSKSLSDVEGVAPITQNSRHQQKQASTSFPRTSESQPPNPQGLLQVSKCKNVSN